MDHRRDQLFNHALRTVAFHFTKIGEAIRRYADDSDALLSDRAPPSRNARYEPCPDEPSRVVAARSNRRKDQNPHPPKSKTWDRPTTSSADLPSYPHSDPAPYHSASYRDGSSPNYPSYPPEDSDVPIDYKSVQRRRKRRATDVPPFLPKEGLHDATPASSSQRPSKRVRINWSEAENKTFFDTVTKFSHLDEANVLKEIVKEMEGARTWIQCKGHFRNLVVVGRIVHRTTPPKGWVVVDDAKGKRASPRSVALNQVSRSQKEEGRAEEPGKIVEVDTASPANTDKGKDVQEGSETGNIDTDDKNSGVQSDKDPEPDYTVEEDDETMAPDMELPVTEIRKPAPTNDHIHDQAGGSSTAREGSSALQTGADIERESDEGTPKDELLKEKQSTTDPSNQMGNTTSGFRARGGWIRRAALRRVAPNAGRNTLQWDVARQLSRRDEEE